MIATALKAARSAHSPAPGFAVRLAAIIALGLLLASLFPVGYVGGGADDGRYLEAARCMVAEGYCVPANHWAARLPLVLPASTALFLFGESRATLMLVPLAYAVGALALLAHLTRQVAGERAALVAVLVMVGTPVFISRWTRLNVDIPELFFLLAALSLLLAAIRRDQARLALVAGALIGLAVLSRTTAIAAAPIIVAGLALFTPRPVRWTALLAIGGAILLAAEAALHAITAGRPLLSWELALAHTRIPTSALPSTLDLSRSPILNPDYIAAWHRPAGIHVHWLLDGALNLLAHPAISLTLWVSLLFASATWMVNRTPARSRSSVGMFLAVAAAAYFAILTYVLAVHPAPRMFLPIAGIGAFAVGCWAARHEGRRESALVGTILFALIALTAVTGLRSANLSAYQQEAERWAGTSPQGLTISRTAASAFALSEELSRLPRGPAAGKPMIGITPGCGAAPSRLLRRFVHEPDWPIAHRIARRIGLAGRPPTLCLISPAGRAPSPRP